MIRRPPRSTLTHSFPTRRSSDLASGGGRLVAALGAIAGLGKSGDKRLLVGLAGHPHFAARRIGSDLGRWIDAQDRIGDRPGAAARSEEHTSELQSLMRISYAVFCLKKKNTHKKRQYEI